jgi:hypothetical protein
MFERLGLPHPSPLPVGEGVKGASSDYPLDGPAVQARFRHPSGVE